ncbi:RNA 2',3'-cyclic phosphodiesterase [Candidatus Pacearchaeota archaeon]|nr:RNA 2',3'-cyclic phosphodiesterase [Candidatus Pacearchaeota archaeon]
MRCFISIDLPSHVKSRIFHKFGILGSKGLFKGKLVKKDDLQLTLKFLGNLSEDKIKEVKRKLKEIKFSKFEGKIGRTGFFDNQDNIKVVWVELLADRINKLGEEISKILGEFKKDDSTNFNPHITMAKVDQVLNKQELVKEVQNMNFRKLDFEIKEFLLIKSELTKKGLQYKILDKFTLN